MTQSGYLWLNTLTVRNFDRKKHWENIYITKELENCSWYQPTPVTSLQFIEDSGISASSKIIDIGGGDSFLTDTLLSNGFTDVTVLDISETALERAKKRLGEKAKKVKWITGDVNRFTPHEKYDLWHDRAAFHFLTDEDEVQNYVTAAKNAIREEGILIVGIFSENGPEKCSGIEIRRYSQKALSDVFRESFMKLKCLNVDHPTPFNTIQSFTFCSFKKLKS